MIHSILYENFCFIFWKGAIVLLDFRYTNEDDDDDDYDEKAPLVITKVKVLGEIVRKGVVHFHHPKHNEPINQIIDEDLLTNIPYTSQVFQDRYLHYDEPLKPGNIWNIDINI